jgi:hypothetical protein
LETCWSPKVSAIKAQHSHIRNCFRWWMTHTVANVLENPKTISTHQSFLQQIYFQFLCPLVTWNPILNHDKVNRPLQVRFCIQKIVLYTGKIFFYFLIANSQKGEVLHETSLDFEFLSSSVLTNMEFTELEWAVNSLAMKYNKDPDALEFGFKVESFKHHTQIVLPHSHTGGISNTSRYLSADNRLFPWRLLTKYRNSSH